MQQSYSPYNQYDRPIAYNNAAYNNVNCIPTEYAPQAASMYGRSYPMQGYNQGYQYQDYSQAVGGMYNVAAAPGFPAQNMNYMNGIGRGRGRGRGGYFPPARGGQGVFPQKKKPFVGGSLETQKEWERQTGCCFFKQGKCKFGDRCRFVHQGHDTLPCQFGENCRTHGLKAKEENVEGEATAKNEVEVPSNSNAEAIETSKEKEA